MILKASQRAGGMQLARHLLNEKDNDHVEVHQLRGFVSDTLTGAFKEAYAISRGTRCRQFLFSVSLNPPERETVAVDVFEAAIAEIEKRLKLTEHPRAIVFHEKEGRRHAHAVWSRIDVSQMKAVNLPHYKYKLRDIAREIYLEQGWTMPKGFVDPAQKNPLNFTLEEWQQAKRMNADPKEIKKTLQDCWAISDTKDSFESALNERGYWLAKGDRRGHVILDWRGEIYSLPRWLNIKFRDVKKRLGSPDNLPSVDSVRVDIKKRISEQLKFLAGEVDKKYQTAARELQKKKRELVLRQRSERHQLAKRQTKRHQIETRQRMEQLPRGFKALFWRISGRLSSLKGALDSEAQQCDGRDQNERQTLIETQLCERQKLQKKFRQHRERQSVKREMLSRDVGASIIRSDSVNDVAEKVDGPNQPFRRRTRRR